MLFDVAIDRLSKRFGLCLHEFVQLPLIVEHVLVEVA